MFHCTNQPDNKRNNIHCNNRSTLQVCTQKKYSIPVTVQVPIESPHQSIRLKLLNSCITDSAGRLLVQEINKIYKVHL